MIVTLWLQVVKNPKHSHDSGELYTREIVTNYIPSIDDWDSTILYLNDLEDANPLDGPVWYFKRRYMDFHGNWHLELRKIMVDPQYSEITNDQCTVWNTEVDGDPIPKLKQSGWQKHE